MSKHLYLYFYLLPFSFYLVSITSCGSPSAPSALALDNALPVQTTTAHYVFHSVQADAVQPDTQEAYHAWLIGQLGVPVDRAINYYKYRDRAHMQQVTGKVTNGWADPPGYAVHSIWPWDNHEVVHIVTALIGRPTDFFNEGIAVAMQMDPQHDVWEPMWNSRSIHGWAADYHRNREMPALADMLETDAFRRLDDTKSYPMAGSFVRFMIDDRGMERMKAFFRTGSREARRADIDREFNGAFGVSLSDAERRWHTFLDAR